jgi:ABC-type lipoprotein release transport system permease subunit
MRPERRWRHPSLRHIFGPVSEPTHDLSKLRIDRDPPLAVRRAFGRTLVIAAAGSVLASFLAESALIAAVGGLVGCLLALPMNGVVTSTTNWASFSEIAFSFRITPGLLAAGVVFAVVMGMLGGFFPARRASKLPVVQAIR